MEASHRHLNEANDHVTNKFKAGIPLQLVTDCGSETTKTFGIANVLR